MLLLSPLYVDPLLKCEITFTGAKGCTIHRLEHNNTWCAMYLVAVGYSTNSGVNLVAR